MSLLKSPMGLMVGFMVIMVFVMPKMMENIGKLQSFYIQEWIRLQISILYFMKETSKWQQHNKFISFKRCSSEFLGINFTPAMKRCHEIVFSSDSFYLKVKTDVFTIF
jgi:hypothetical protein